MDIQLSSEHRDLSARSRAFCEQILQPHELSVEENGGLSEALRPELRKAVCDWGFAGINHSVRITSYNVCYTKLLRARGALRLALKAAGLSPDGLRAEQLRVVLERVLPDELEKYGVERAQAVCAAVSLALANLPASQHAAQSADTDEIFP